MMTMKSKNIYKLAAVLGMLLPLQQQGAAAFETNTGELQNLVCFVRFADEAEVTQQDDRETRAFEYTPTDYEQLFNDASADANSVTNYFRVASYGQLTWRSTFFPVQTGERTVSMQVSHNRTYYQQQSSVASDGYSDETERANRELTLVTEVCNLLNAQLPDDMVIDQNGDGFVDNLTIVLSNGSEISNKHLLWPHRSDMMLPEDKALRIKGKKMTSYLMVFDYANGYGSQLNPLRLSTGVLCHEMSHSLGTYDLYHVSGSLNPVGVWDLMSDNQHDAQQMTAYTKWRYCKWLGDIPAISEPGAYSLNPVGGSSAEGVAYRIQPVGHDEYFVVEYRKREGFDKNLPGEGLLVYRINPAYTGGNVNYNGTTRLDEQYIFRPGGTTTADGQLSLAALSAESGRTGIGGTASLQPFYSDGSPANFAITNVGTCGETITFTLEAAEHRLLLSDEALTLNGQQSSAATLTVASDDAWTISGMPAWLTVSPSSGEAGTTTVTITAAADNETGIVREAMLTVSSTASTELAKTVTISQEPKMTGVILFDDFENTDNPVGWTMENSGEQNRGWQFTEGTPTGKTKKMVNSGTHAMTMVETIMEDLHQEARLTSPTFANGRTLSFYSHSNGGNATPKINPPVYIIEVSNDGGATWTTIFDLLKDYPRDEEGNTVKALTYTKITLDLSPYTSDQMKIRFNCYDTSQEGLQYWWQIDDLEITETGSQTTGVGTTPMNKNKELNKDVYDLQGRRVSASAVRKGVYIKDGKKVVKNEE